MSGTERGVRGAHTPHLLLIRDLPNKALLFCFFQGCAFWLIVDLGLLKHPVEYIISL